MSFQKIPAASSPRRRARGEAVYLYTRESTRSPDQVETRLRLTRELAERLRWKVGDRLNIYVGVDDDAGSLLLANEPGGTFLLRHSTPSGASLVISSRVIPLPPGINRKVRHALTAEGNLNVCYLA